MTALAESAFRLVSLTRGLCAKVDAADYEWAMQWQWQAVGRPGLWYAVRTCRAAGQKRSVRMHRELLGVSPGLQVDHRNRDSLDNRRSNLRTASVADNGANRSYRLSKTGFRGVHEQASGRFVATARKMGVFHCAGTYDTPLEAALAYDALAKSLFADFANLNFPEPA